MDSLFGAEGSLVVRFVVAFVIVLALIGLTFWLIRRFGTARVGAAAQRGRQPRLAVIDAAPVDGRRRLVLIRRDNVEHLLLTGGPSDLVVEQNIVRAVPVNPPRDVPSPRPPEGARPIADAARAQGLDDDAGWTPSAEPPLRPAFSRPEPLTRPSRPETRPFAEPLARAPLPPSIAPRPIEPAPIVPSGEPDAALASMAQRLEAALRRPGETGAAPQAAASAQELPAGEATPPTAPEDPARNGEKGGKPKTVLDSLEEEMASLLGRPPEKT